MTSLAHTSRHRPTSSLPNFASRPWKSSLQVHLGIPNGCNLFNVTPLLFSGGFILFRRYRTLLRKPCSFPPSIPPARLLGTGERGRRGQAPPSGVFRAAHGVDLFSSLLLFAPSLSVSLLVFYERFMMTRHGFYWDGCMIDCTICTMTAVEAWFFYLFLGCVSTSLCRPYIFFSRCVTGQREIRGVID